MATQYALYKNHFKKGQKEYMARVIPTACCTHEDLIRIMSHRAAGVTKAEVLAVLEEYMLAVESALKQGMSISTPLFKIQTSIQGKFNHEHDRFHHKRHKVKINLSAGKRLKEYASALEVKKIQAVHPTPELDSFKDFTSETTDQLLTPGGLASIEGDNLKFNTADPEQGIFLIGLGKRIQIQQTMHNKPTQLFFLLPKDLSQGTYLISVHATVGNSTEVRTGQLGISLTVA